MTKLTITALLLCLIATEASGQVVRVAGRRTVCENGACRTEFVYGAGFLVAESSTHQYLATAAHILTERAWVGRKEGSMQLVEVLRIDKACDVALLRMPKRFTDASVLPLRMSPLVAGESVVSTGYGGPDGRFVARNLSGLSLDSERIGVDSQPGDSGGPAVVNGECVGVVIRRDTSGAYSRVSPCACWAPWLSGMIPRSPVRPPPVLATTKDDRFEVLERQVSELQALVEQLTLTAGPPGKDAAPFTLRFRSQSKRDPARYFDLGEVTVTGPGEYTIDLPDTTIVWMRDGRDVSTQSFAAGTPIRLDTSTIQPAPLAESTVPN